MLKNITKLGIKNTNQTLELATMRSERGRERESKIDKHPSVA